MTLYECPACHAAFAPGRLFDHPNVWCPNVSCPKVNPAAIMNRVEVYSKREVLELLLELFKEAKSWADQGEDGEGIPEHVDVPDNLVLQRLLQTKIAALNEETTNEETTK